MIPTSYHHSFLNRISIIFHGKTISNIIQIIDETDDPIDNVRFFEIDRNGTIGFYMNGPNPLITRSHIDEFDDFNLYALYSILSEKKEETFIPFRVEFIKVFFHPEYNEVLSIFLSSGNFSASIFIVFSTDEIHTYLNCSLNDLTEMMKNTLTQYKNLEFSTCQIGAGDDKWLCN